MKLYTLSLIAVLALAPLALRPSAAHAGTTSCDEKRGWQREIVERAVQRWFQGSDDPDDLIELIQAEHGIAACAAGSALPPNLHTTTLQTGMARDQLGALLLSNELEWRGVLPSPERALAGRWFEVVRPYPVETPTRSGVAHRKTSTESGSAHRTPR